MVVYDVVRPMFKLILGGVYCTPCKHNHMSMIYQLSTSALIVDSDYNTVLFEISLVDLKKCYLLKICRCVDVPYDIEGNEIRLQDKCEQERLIITVPSSRDDHERSASLE